MSDKESTSTAGTKLRLETERLIELVRQRPCLWNRGDPLYREKGEKERAWREVYRALEPGYVAMSRTNRRDLGVTISRKWANIRDSYKKYLNGTSRGAVASRPYLYAKQLTFLDATYNKEHRRRMYYENKEAEEQEPEEQEWLNEVFVDIDREGESPEPKRIKTEFCKAKDNTEPEESIVSILVNLIEKEDDEDRAFFKSITPTVKSLSDSDKFLFRIRVMKLLDGLKKKDSLPKSETLSKDSDTE